MPRRQLASGIILTWVCSNRYVYIHWPGPGSRTVLLQRHLWYWYDNCEPCTVALLGEHYGAWCKLVWNMRYVSSWATKSGSMRKWDLLRQSTDESCFWVKIQIQRFRILGLRTKFLDLNSAGKHTLLWVG